MNSKRDATSLAMKSNPHPLSYQEMTLWKLEFFLPQWNCEHRKACLERQLDHRCIQELP